tara:strand:+ start:2240 stop:2491 length:252 start_codon:yes stop_codon:yes gene_type:complete
MDGLNRTITRCLGLGGVFLATLVVSAGLLAVFSAAGDHAVETVMKVVASVSLLALLVDGIVLLVSVSLASTQCPQDRNASRDG